MESVLGVRNKKRECVYFDTFPFFILEINTPNSSIEYE